MNKLGLILSLVTTVAIAAVLGLFVYTKILHKRPQITETKEREKLLAKQHQAEAEDANAKRVIVVLDPISTNLDPFMEDGKQKTHYVNLTLAVELRSEKDQGKFSDAKPVVMDKIIQNLGKKKFEDLNQVQGRYIFRSQIIDAANEFLKSPVVTEVYFNDFLLQ